jgi:hypothetical protein
MFDSISLILHFNTPLRGPKMSANRMSRFVHTIYKNVAWNL